MAIAFVNATSGTNDAGGTTLAATAASHTTGNVLVVGIVHTGAGAATGVTDTASNAYTDTGIHAVHGSDRIDIWTAKNITGNAANVVTAAFPSSTFRRVMVLQYSGASTTAPFTAGEGGSFQTASAVTTGTTNTWTTAAANEAIIAFASSSNAQAYAGTSMTARVNSLGTDSGGLDNITTGLAGATVSATITDGSAGQLWIAAISINPAGGAATPNPPSRARQTRSRSTTRARGNFAR